MAEIQQFGHHCIFRRIRIPDLRGRCPLDNGRHFSSPKSASLGSLDVLPSELFFQILAELDLVSLTTFRYVNRLARGLVDTVPEYSYIFTKQPDILRAVLVSSARAYSCASLCAELQRSRCRSCNDSVVDLYLITGTLVCRSCQIAGYKTYQYSPLTWPHVLLLAQATDTPPSAFGQCPRITGLPVGYVDRVRGGYGPPEPMPPTLYDGEAVIHCIIAHNVGVWDRCVRGLYFRAGDADRRRQVIIPCRQQTSSRIEGGGAGAF